MGETLHDIDDLFRKNIEGTTEDPSPQVWADISKALDEDKDRKPVAVPFFWRWFAAACLIGVAVLVYTISSRHTKNAETASDTNPVQRTGQQATAGNRSAINPQQPVQPDNNNSITIHTPVNSTGDDKTNNDPAVPENKQNQKTNMNPVAPVLVNNTPATTDQKNNPDVQQKKQIILPDHKNALTQNDNQPVNNPGQQLNRQHKLNSHNPDLTVDINNPALVSQKNKQKGNLTDKINQQTEPETVIYSMQKPGTLPESFTWNQNSLNSLWQPATPPELSSKHYFPQSSVSSNTAKAKLIKLAKAKGSWAITPFYSPDITWREIQDMEDDHGPGGPGQHHEDHNAIRNIEHKPVSWTAGVLVDKTFGGKLGIQTGLSFTKVSIRQQDRLVYAERDDRGEVGYRVNCSTGYAYVSTKTSASSSAPVVGDSISLNNAQNVFEYVNVPLLLQYRFVKGKFTAAVKGGPQLSFLAKGQTSAILENSPNAKTPVTNSIQGLKKMTPEAVFGFSAEYQLTKSLSMVIAPATRFSLGTVNNAGNVSSRSGTFGVNAGLRISL